MFEKDIIGAILKKRIKEMGYTQEQFAEKAGIGISSLKKYMNGTTAYNYELMGTFAELLDCSFDYLLGLSKSTKREYHEVGEVLRLSDRAIEKIAEYAKDYDRFPEAKRFIHSLDVMVRSEGFISCIADYLVSSRYMQDAFQLIINAQKMALYNNPNYPKEAINDIYALDYEKMELIFLVTELEQARKNMRSELIQELKEVAPLDVIEEKLNSVKK